MSNLSTLNNQFVFNISENFITPEIEEKYSPILEANKHLYPSIINYINSNILSITSPSIELGRVTQTLSYGKKIDWLDARPTMDDFSHEVTIKFRDVDSSLLYFIILDLIVSSKNDVENNYVPNISVTVIDKNRMAYLRQVYKSCLLKSLPEKNFNNNENIVNDPTFSLSFSFNYISIELLSPIILDRSLLVGTNRNEVD